jgi:hypothetical protein
MRPMSTPQHRPTTARPKSDTGLGALAVGAGFNIETWSDTTDAARAWFVALAERIRDEGTPPLGFRLLLGPEFQVMAQNQRRNLEDGRMDLAQVAASR